jgi:hypothetical protein
MPRALGGRKRPREEKKMATDKSAKNEAAPAAETTSGMRAPAAASGQVATLRYLDRADLAETFADCVTSLMFDGQTLRIELGVTRFDEMKTNTPISGRRYPACRIVLPPAAAVDLINRMQQIAAALAQAGVVKAAPRQGEAPKAD